MKPAAMKDLKAWLGIGLVASAAFGLIWLSSFVPDHLTPSAEPLAPVTASQRFPDTAEVLRNAIPPAPEPAPVRPAESS